MRDALILVLMLAACAQKPPGSAPVTTAVAGPGAAAASGEARIGVVAATREGRSVAADCTASGQGFDAGFSAPGVVAVPTFGSSSGVVRIACSANGLSGAIAAAPTLSRSGGGGGWPAVGIGVSSGGGTSVSVGGVFGGGWSGGPYGSVVRYPDVEVTLE